MWLIYILLAIIAYFLYRIYRQKQDVIDQEASDKFDAEWEAKKREEFKAYPHLYGKLQGNWLEVFSRHAGTPGHLLKIMFYLMLGESCKIDYSEGSLKYDTLWDCTKELLEHLETYHEGTVAEHEIALTTYWQVAATRMGELIEENPNTASLSSNAHTSEVAGEKVEVPPFTDIENISSLFPKKENHPENEITFFNPDGSFPRDSEGSARIDEKMRVFGI